MNNQLKRRFLRNHKKSSALVLSIIIHGAFILVAISFVAVKVIIKPEQNFEAMEIKRPKMKLRKLQVPVKQKKSQAPKLRQNIVTKPKLKDISIKMPETVGVIGGMGSGRGDGLGGLGFGFDMDLFGSSKAKGSGNEFIGVFYDLKQDKRGELTEIGKLAETDKAQAEVLCAEVIKNFVESGFRVKELDDFFAAPKRKYATSFNMPSMSANAAPQAFGVDDQVKPSFWLCVYRGQITAPEDGRYRFWGLGDDVLTVRVRRRVVLDACWPEKVGKLSNWTSSDDDSRVFPVNGNILGSVSKPDFSTMIRKIAPRIRGGESPFGLVNEFQLSGDYLRVGNRLVIGDWFQLRKGQKVDMEVLIGEIPGGEFTCRLLIEQRGKQYQLAQSDAGQRMVLPVFKTIPIDDKIAAQMKSSPDEMTLDGPNFGVLEEDQKR